MTYAQLLQAKCILEESVMDDDQWLMTMAELDQIVAQIMGWT